MNTGTIDSTAPAVVSVSVIPSPIDTGAIAQNIEITLNMTDALSGLRSASLTFQDRNANAKHEISGFVFFSNVTSGDAPDGVYKITSSIPQGTLHGIWTFDIFVADQVGNRATITEPAGASFEVSNSAIGALGDLSHAADATQYV